MSTAQMNVRIDSMLKRDGDAVFASIGKSATDMVRMLWEFAAKNAGSLESVSALIKTMESIESEADAEKERKIRCFEEGLSLAPALYSSFGLDSRNNYSAMRPEERADAAFQQLLEDERMAELDLRERLAEKGLW